MPALDSRILDSRTSASLLQRLRSGRDESAWDAFVDRYGSRIFDWCLRRKLQPVDAEDVTQNVLVRMTSALSRFDYDESLSFRGWLRRVTENAIVDLFRERGRTAGDPRARETYQILEHEEARHDLMQRLESLFDLEVFEHAQECVRQRIAENRWQAWELTAVQQLSANDVAERLSMRVASVYTARSQVQQMIQREVQRLETPVCQ